MSLIIDNIPSVPVHRCSRGRLLREFRDEVWRASAYVGSKSAMSGTGRQIVMSARGRVTREMTAKFGGKVLDHMPRIMRTLERVEKEVLFG